MSQYHPRHAMSNYKRRRKSDYDYGNDYESDQITPFSSAFFHQAHDFIPIPTQQLILYLHCYDNHLDVRSASTITNKTLFSGGIQLGRKNFRLDNRDAVRQSEKWKIFSISMWRYLHCAKFAAAVVDPDPNNNEPLCLQLELLDIEIKRTATGKLTFKYYLIGTPEARRHEIPNVHTFYLDNNILDVHGNLQSTISAIIPETSLYEFKKLMTKIADFTRANPCLITEAIPEKHNADLIPTLPQTAELHGNGYGPAIDTTTLGFPNTTSNNNNNNNNAMGQHYLSRIPWGSKPVFPNDPKTKKITTPEHDNYAKAIDLPEGRKLVNGPIPEVPTELLNLKTSNKEDIYLSFGLPLSMISNSASSGSMRNNTGQKGASSGGSGGNSSGSSARMIFQAYQQDMKNFTINMIETMYNAIYMRQHYKQVKEKYAKHHNTKIDANNIHMFTDEIFVSVSIPGQPNDDVLKELLTIGALKYEFYKEVTAARYGIPIEAFNEKLQLTVQEMNGIVEKDDSTPKPPAKKKAKK